MTTSHGGKDTHLAVIHLALASTPLVGDADRVLALLHETTFIDEQAAMLTPTKQLISLLGYLLHDRLIIPLRLCQLY